MNPQNVEKKPINNRRYLIYPRAPITVPGFLSEKHRIVANTKRINPCITSPNITPKRKGNVTMVKIAGLISLKAGTP